MLSVIIFAVVAGPLAYLFYQLQERNEQLSKDLNNLKSENVSVNKKCKELSDKLSQLYNRVRELENTNKELDWQVGYWKANAEENQLNVKQLREIKEREIEIYQLKSDIDYLNEKLTFENNLNAQLRGEIKVLQQKEITEQEKNSALEVENAALKSTLETRNKQIEEMTTNQNTLSEATNHWKNKANDLKQLYMSAKQLSEQQDTIIVKQKQEFEHLTDEYTQLKTKYETAILSRQMQEDCVDKSEVGNTDSERNDSLSDNSTNKDNKQEESTESLDGDNCKHTESTSHDKPESSTGLKQEAEIGAENRTHTEYTGKHDETETKTVSQVQHQAEKNQSYVIDSAIVTTEGMVLGQRSKHDNSILTNTLEFDGVSNVGSLELNRQENSYYPCCLCEASGTQVLKPVLIEGTTTGVTEPILRKALQEEFSDSDLIRILERVALPIKNRSYGYIPDIVLYIPSSNCYVDIEIDEPYDLISRKPIHYMGCSDQLRNLYFIENGWVVIRCAEQQVVEQLPNVIQYIGNICRKVTNSNVLKKEVEKKREFLKRWTKEEAIVMSSQLFRESYLRIDKPEEKEVLLDDYHGEMPSLDILTDKVQIYNDLLNNTSGHPYTKVSVRKYNNDYIFKNGSVKVTMQGYEYGWKVFDEIEQKEVFIPFSDVRTVVPLDSLWLYPESFSNYPKIHELVKEAFYSGRPIHIRYRNNKGEETERDILYLTHWLTFNDTGENAPYNVAIQVQFDKRFIQEQIEHFVGLCMYRHESRTFKVQNILNIRLFNCHKCCYQFNSDSIWTCVKANQPLYARYLFDLLGSSVQRELISQMNYAHSFVLTDQVDQAISIYLSHDEEEKVMGDLLGTWGYHITNDLQELIGLHLSEDNCKLALEKLKVAGWSIEEQEN